MNNDGKLYIIITDQRPDGVTPNPPNSTANPQKKKKEENSILTDYLKHRFFNFIESQAQQYVDYQLNNIGNFTGNYVAQRDAQSAKSILNTVSNIALSAWTGFKASGGNVAGAIIGAGIAVASQTINFFQQENANLMQFKRQEYSIEMLRQRSGLYALENGSRTGDW